MRHACGARICRSNRGNMDFDKIEDDRPGEAIAAMIDTIPA
jgi:hypothetical protein